MKAEFYDVIGYPDGGVRVRARNLKFASMSQAAFEQLYSTAVDVLLHFVLHPGRGWSRVKVDDLVERVINFALGSAVTREEKQYLNDVAQLGCIACRTNGFSGTPAEVHHQRSGIGAGRRASHFDTMPLCPGHHRYLADAIHVNATLFVELYGLEAELVRNTREDVQYYRQTFVGYIGG